MSRSGHGIALATGMLCLLAGCQKASVETFDTVDGSAVRSMMRGDVRHGWEVTIRPNGAQHWVHWENGQLTGDVNLEADGHVTDASYEGAGYVLEVRKYVRGEPVGTHILEMLSLIHAEADRRQILLPNEWQKITSETEWMAQGLQGSR